MGPELSKMIGMNLDPSHLMIQGAEPIAAARELGDKIFYVHGKDARIERGLADVDGLLENLPVDQSKIVHGIMWVLVVVKIFSGGKNSFLFVVW